MLVAAGPDVLAIEDGTPLVVDANAGILLKSPPKNLVSVPPPAIAAIKSGRP
jgi:hypothetical protein